MNEMVERVARAICAVEEPDHDPGENDEGREPPLWCNYIAHAFAAIATMREPTRHMKDAGAETYGAVNVGQPTKAYVAMIDAALGGK